MIRVSSMVRSSCAGPNPGVISGDDTGARMNSATPRTASPMSMRLMTVETTRQARGASFGGEQRRHDRDQGRGQRAGGDELEDEIRDAECGEERVQFGRRRERAAITITRT